MDADVDLFAIIFGESIFNDAIAIVMYNIVMKSDVTNDSVGAQIKDGALSFLLIFIGSLWIGGVFALISAFILKR